MAFKTPKNIVLPPVPSDASPGMASFCSDILRVLQNMNIGIYSDIQTVNGSVSSVYRVGSIMQTEEIITLSADDPWFCLASPTATMNAANYVDFVPYLRSLRAHVKWTSAKLTGTVTLAGNALSGSSTNFDPELDVDDLTFIDKLNQFRYCATRTSDTAATVSEPGTAAAGAKIFKITRQSDPASFNFDFPITAYQITGAAAFSLWMNEGSDTKYPENYILLRAMAAAYATDREYGTLTFAEAVGGIPAGDYQITGITLANIGTSSAVITCSASGLTPDVKTANTSSFNVYPHRIAGSTTTARHYEITDAALMSDGIYNVLGMRTRDYFQGHLMGRSGGGSAGRLRDASIGGSGAVNFVRDVGDTTNEITIVDNALDETPRTGPRTHPRAGIFNLYIYVGTFTA